MSSRRRVPTTRSTVSTWTKSTAMMPRACAARNCLQVGPTRRGAGSIPASREDPPYRGSGDLVAEPDQLALHPPVPPGGALRGDADHELADRGGRGRPPGTTAARVVPLARDNPPVPGEQRRRGHREHLAPPAAGNQPRQRCKPQPVARLVTDPADLTAQDRVLVPEHQQLGILGHPLPCQHHQTAEQAAYKQVEGRNDHSAIIPVGKFDHARSNNRAPQDHMSRLLDVMSSNLDIMSSSPYVSDCGQDISRRTA